MQNSANKIPKDHMRLFKVKLDVEQYIIQKQPVTRPATSCAPFY